MRRVLGAWRGALGSEMLLSCHPSFPFSVCLPPSPPTSCAALGVTSHCDFVLTQGTPRLNPHDFRHN